MTDYRSYAAPPKAARPHPRARRHIADLAVLAASVSLVAIASPAYAQCVEGPPSDFVCSGTTDDSQIIFTDDATVTASPGFEVDTSTNGNGLPLQVTGDGMIRFTGAPILTGAGVRFSTTGASGISEGGLDISSAGTIIANGANGLRLDNNGGGDTVASWTGSIANAGGNGVFARNFPGSGELSLLVGDVRGRDDGIRVEHGGSGAATITATGPVIGDTAAGVRIGTVGAAGSIDLNVAQVTGSTFGILLDNGGTGFSKVAASGTVTGLNEDGIRVAGGANTLDIDIRAARVDGLIAGIRTDNQGTGNTAISTSGPVTGQGYGIFAIHGPAAKDLSIAAVDVSGFYGIRIYNEGTGSTLITSTGLITGTDFGIIAENVEGSKDMTVRAAAISADGNGIEVRNSGSGTTTVAVDTVTGLGDVGVRITVEELADSVDLTIGDATGGGAGAVISNSGNGAARLTATGTVTGVGGPGINVGNHGAATDIVIHAHNVNGNGFAGILALNDGIGDTLVETTGLVANDGVDGIGAVNLETARNLSVSAVDVMGGIGIAASNFGTGSTDVVSTGTVTGFSFDGVTAGNLNNGTDLRVDVNVVNGDDRGVYLRNLGTGLTSLRARGTVTGITSTGIAADIGTTAKDVSVDVVDVTGTSGIRIDNQGIGATRIAATGTVTGTVGDGINVFAFTQAGDVRIDVADVSGSTGGVIVTNYGTGSSSIAASGTVSALAADGFGIAVASGTGSTDIHIAVADVIGNARAIHAENLGTGETVITSTGTVTGGGDIGIFARNDVGSTDLRISANIVVGAEDGIVAEHSGGGIARVAATTTTGSSGAGIRIQAAGAAAGVEATLVDAGGATYGVLVVNNGSGSSRIDVSGTATALDGAGTGIAVLGGTASTDLSVAAGVVVGGAVGIDTDLAGSGDTLILAGGLVTGGEVAIRARNGVGAAGIGIRTADVQSAGSGIVAENLGTGRTVVRAEGMVTAQGEAGIAVLTGAAANDVVVNAKSVSGAFGGIWVENGGIGSTTIAATGAVSGDDFGIIGQNDVNATDLAIAAVDAKGASNAILAVNLGTGTTRVTTTGTVTGESQAGIQALAGVAADDLILEVGNVSGGINGVAAINFGLGDTSITVNGTVQGAAQAIEAFADGNQSVILANNGIIRNTSGLASDRAIRASGGGVGIGNAGLLVGMVEIAGDQSLMVNSGTWRSIGGASNFATLDDTLLNTATGTLVGASAGGSAETTIWQGLEHFTNQGVLLLRDGGTGDLIQTSAATSFAKGSLLSVDIAGIAASDLYHTGGTVTIEAGSRLEAVASEPLALHGKYVIVQADAGVTGQFSFDDQLLTAFAGLRDGYTATTAFIEFAQLKDFTSAGLTPNQKQTGAGADGLPDGSALKDALLLLPDEPAAQDAFDQLSGEIHPAARGAMFDDSRLVRDAVLDRLAGGVPGWNAWARGFDASGENDGDFNAARMNRDAHGGVIGIDRDFGVLTIGVAGGWTNTDLQIDRRASNGSVKTAHALAYAGASLGNVQLRGGLGYGWTTAKTRRSIAFQGYSDQLSARTRGSGIQGFGEVGYRLPLSGGTVEPFANLTTIRLRTSEFAEQGGLAALNGKAISESRTASILGLRFETAEAGPLSIRGSIGWNRAWGDLDPVGLHAFAGGAPFTVLGAGGSRNSALARFDAQIRMSSNVTLSLGYDGLLGDRGEDHAVTGGLKIVF